MKELVNFIQNPYDDINAYELAQWYYYREDYAGAVSFYLRVCEVSKDNLLIYKSLVKIGLCLYKQGWRVVHTKGYLLHAISLLPKRPEAYFLLCKLYEENKEWQESYTLCELALNVCDFTLEELSELEYIGKWGFLFEKSISCWWMGREKESIDISTYLYENVQMPESYLNVIKGNINLMYGTINYAKPNYYTKDKLNDLRFKFNGVENIEQNYSQAFQDIFVLTVLNGKKEGKYLEIGAYHPYEHSNTFLLEKYFGWKGYSLDIVRKSVVNFNGKRSNECGLYDATVFDYKSLMDKLNWENEWDYLQLDCEPASNTYLALLQIPFSDYKFRVITYEHDWYTEKNIYRDKSRKYLKDLGYELLISNISVDHKSPFEDWWVHPELVDRDIIDNMKCVDDDIRKIDEYIYIH